MVNPLAIGSTITAFISSITFYFLVNQNSTLIPSTANLGGQHDADSHHLFHVHQKMIDPETVYVKTIADVNSSLIYSGNWFVNVHVPWSYFCQRLEEDWERLARDIYLSDIDLQIASINAQLNPGAASLLEISGYPNLIFLRNGTYRTFPSSWNRSYEELLLFAKGAWQVRQPYQLPLSPYWWFKAQLIVYNYCLSRLIQLNKILEESMAEHPAATLTALCLVLSLFYFTFRIMKFLRKTQFN